MVYRQTCTTLLPYYEKVYAMSVKKKLKSDLP